MPPNGRIQTIPGIPSDAERVLLEALNGIIAEQQRLTRPPQVTGLKNDGHFATEGSIVRLRGGQRVALPRARAENAGARIVVIVEVAGAISITSHRGFVNGARVQTLSDVGAYEFFSNGVDGWYLQGSLPGTSSGASALDAEYVLGAAHASLPNGRAVATSTEIAPDVSSPGVITWALRSASVVFSRLADLTGLSVLGRASTSAGVMAAITATAARQTLRVNEAGTSLAWGFPIEGQSAGADQGDAHTVNVASGDGVDLALGVSSGVATITPTIDVSDFAGGGLEDDGSNNLRTSAVTGAISRAAGSTASLFAGIRDNGTSETARTFLNFVNTAFDTTVTVTQDAGNDELEVRVSTLGSFYAENSVGSIQTKFISFDDGTGIIANVADNTGGSGYINVSFSLASIAGLSVLGRSASSAGTPAAITATAARQTFMANSAGTAIGWRAFELDDLPSIGNNRILVNVSGGTAPPSAPTIASLLGGGLSFDDPSQTIQVDADEERHVFIDPTNGVSFRKSRVRHYFFEEFDLGMAAGSITAGSGTTANIPAANTNWLLSGVGGAATLEPQTPTNNHLGIWRLASAAVSGQIGLLHRGLNELRFDEMRSVEAILRVPTVTTMGFQFGLSDEAQAGSNCIVFVVDTSAFGNANIRARTAEATTLTTTDTGVTLVANAWNVYTIIQETAGTVDFYIDDVLEATHSTNVPDAETGGVHVMVYPRAAATRTIDIDYVSFESDSLGARTS